MAYRHHGSYSAKIKKSEHIEPNGKADLHVHVFFNQGQSRRPLGRYRLPTLEPVFPSKERELSGREIKFLKDWLAEPEQLKKLQKFLDETIFDMHKIGKLAYRFGEILTEVDGETYITIRVPVSQRIR